VLGDGHIDPTGKTEDEIMREVRIAALKWSNERPMLMSTDFRSSLLSQARQFKKQKRHQESVLYYATWFEHWINGVLILKLNTLDELEKRQMIRDVSLRGKFTWLLALIHQTRISQRHLNAILQVNNIRNEFVHYKYKLVDVDTWKTEVQPLRQAEQKAEAAVRYLANFESRHFFKGSSRNLLKKLRNTANEAKVTKRVNAVRHTK
jgi:hypothetical protein